MHTDTQTHTQTDTNRHIHTCMNTFTHTYIHTHIHEYARTYTSTNTHTQQTYTHIPFSRVISHTRQVAESLLSSLGWGQVKEEGAKGAWCL